VILGLRKVSAKTSQSGLSTDSPKHAQTYRCNKQNRLDKEVNKGTYTELRNYRTQPNWILPTYIDFSS
jgi:hypothetical protein